MPTLKTPFFGSAYSARSTNLSEQRLINLYPELVEARGGKAIGAFFGAPGLDLKATCGGGPIQDSHVMGGVLFVVSGGTLYRVTSAFTAQAIGAVPASGPNLYSMFDVNGMLGIIAGNSFYVHIETAVTVLTGGTISNPGALYKIGDTVELTPTGGQQNSPATITVTSVAEALTGGAITGGIGFNVFDTVLLQPVGGTQLSPATATITAVAGGVPTALSISDGGAFTAIPASFLQLSTSGTGTGFNLGSPTYATGAVTGFNPTTPGVFTANPTGFTQNVTDGLGGSFALSAPTFGSAPAIMPVILPFSVLPSVGPLTGCQCDGFGLLSQPGSNIFWQSDEGDIITWDALNFNSATGDPDNIVALFQTHREIFIFKEYDTEVWVNAGNPDFVFARLTSVFIETGCAAAASIAQIGETLMLLTKNTLGEGVVVQMRGYAPTRISTHAIEHAIQEEGPAAIAAATAFTYQQEGHQFYQLNVGSKTWVYDLTTSGDSGMPIWHERAAFANGVLSRHRASCAAHCYGLVLVGDFQNGNIYAYNLDTLLDASAPRKWLRSWRAVPQASLDPMRFSELTIDMQTGVGVPAGEAPLVMLRWSDDGGHNWSNPMMIPVGPPGATAFRVRALPLGSTRRETGLDRIFELSGTDIFPTALLGAELR